MNCEWLIEKSSGDQEYYNNAPQSISIYSNPLMENIERNGFITILTQKETTKILPAELSPLIEVKSSQYYYTRSSLSHSKSLSRTIIALSSLTIPLSTELLIEELKMIKKICSGDIFIFLCDSWVGKEESLLKSLSAFMITFGYIPKVIEFQTLGWSSQLKDSSFHLLGMKWVMYDSYFQHFFLSKGAHELQIYPHQVGKTLKEVKISRNHVMTIDEIKTSASIIQIGDDTFIQKILLKGQS